MWGWRRLQATLSPWEYDALTMTEDLENHTLGIAHAHGTLPTSEEDDDDESEGSGDGTDDETEDDENEKRKIRDTTAALAAIYPPAQDAADAAQSCKVGLAQQKQFLLLEKLRHNTLGFYTNSDQFCYPLRFQRFSGSGLYALRYTPFGPQQCALSYHIYCV